MRTLPAQLENKSREGRKTIGENCNVSNKILIRIEHILFSLFFLMLFFFSFLEVH
jgi:hypothetical protein